MYTHTLTQRQICDTLCPYDPHAPYGQEEGRENKHTALWVTAAWQPARPRGLRCWSNIAMVGTNLFSVPMLPSCFIYCSLVYELGGSVGEKNDFSFLFWAGNLLLTEPHSHHRKSSKTNKTYINHAYTQCTVISTGLPLGTTLSAKW